MCTFQKEWPNVTTKHIIHLQLKLHISNRATYSPASEQPKRNTRKEVAYICVKRTRADDVTRRCLSRCVCFVGRKTATLIRFLRTKEADWVNTPVRKGSCCLPGRVRATPVKNHVFSCWKCGLMRLWGFLPGEHNSIAPRALSLQLRDRFLPSRINLRGLMSLDSACCAAASRRGERYSSRYCTLKANNTLGGT